ncbi:MAG: hypothetical protein O3A47_10015 [Chloroflexi bacterium]|nr:hypothetical protein [Chloroflexota bacterium]
MKHDTLSPKQIAALPYIVAAPNLSRAAELAEIGRSTLHRWMQDDEFRSNLEQLRDESSELDASELRGLMLKAVVVLADALNHPSPTIGIRAARVTLESAFKANDYRELQRRVDLIDEAFLLSRST